MRIPIIAGNWKMNTTVTEAVALASGLLEEAASIEGVEKVICPPFISLTTVKDIINGSSLKLGAQNIFYEEKGAFTGEISPLMLAGICQHVIIGHSERRQHFGETDHIINLKLKAAFKMGLKPIFCVGEKLTENESGQTEEVLVRQLTDGLTGIENIDDMVIGYEPIWAIGTGKAATGEQANNTIGLIRRTIANLYNQNVADKVRIQYGGSVNSQNIAEFMRQPEIDGALVGGACLKADQFTSIIQQTAAIRGRQQE